MKTTDNATTGPDRGTSLPWWSSIRGGSRREQINLVAGLLFLLTLLLILALVGLTRQFHPAPLAAQEANPALTQVDPPRRNSSLVYDPLQRVVLLFGGTLLTPGGALTNQTWTWNGHVWQQQHPRTAPPALQGTMVYDAASQQVILFLDQVQSDGTVANEMWLWQGDTWQQLPTTHPPEVLGASMAYDAAHGEVILFGGTITGSNGNADTLSNATWTWNGHTWQEQQPPTAPSPRTGTAMAYDEADQQIVLYGGTTATGLSAETWTWNGTNWQQIVPAATPSPRQNPLLVYDSASRQMVLLGGINPAGTQPAAPETWVWEHHTWQRIITSGTPADLYESAVYDDATRTVLVYAVQGTIAKLTPSTTASPASQTWIWNGSTWQLLR